MPHIIVRGIEAEQMRAISTSMVQELAELCECGTDNFTIECLHSTAVFEGQLTASFPFIEVGWFERGQATRDRFAEAVTKHVLSVGVPEVEVVFVTYREDSYYINGKNCLE
ncbi:DUF1904 family protein [Paenibacillus marinisediminis]